jgi:hypothetical protein
VQGSNEEGPVAIIAPGCFSVQPKSSLKLAICLGNADPGP